MMDGHAVESDFVPMRRTPVYGIRSAAGAAPPVTPSQMADQLVQRDMQAAVLTVRAETLDVENRSVEAVLATEGRVRVYDFRRFREIEEVLLVRGAEMPDQVVLLESHCRWSIDCVLGSIRNVRVDGKQIIGRLFFAEGDDRAEAAWNKVRQGHITDVSVGYRSVEFDDIEPGQSQKVEGIEYRAGALPLRITRQWEVREASLVPIGADPASKIREAAPAAHSTRTITMNQQLRQYLESIGLRAEATDQEAWAYMAQLTDTNQASRAAAYRDGRDPDEQRTETEDPPPPPADDDSQRDGSDQDAERAAAVERARAAERTRIATIREIAGTDVPNEMVERAINNGWDADRMRAQVLDHIRSTSHAAPAIGGAAIHTRNHAEQGTRRDQEDLLALSLMHRGDLVNLERRFEGVEIPPDVQRLAQLREQRGELADRYAELSLLDMCRQACRVAGISEPYGREETIRAATSTSSLANIFTTNVNVQLQLAYMEAEDTTSWAAVTDVADFKTNERPRVAPGDDLDRLPAGGTAKDASFSDSKEEYRIYRFARKFTVDEQDIINDRLGVLRDTPRRFGDMAARVRPDLVYYILLANAALGVDSVALFHANHSNLGSATLNAAGVEGGLTAMRKQTENGKHLNVRAQHMLVPADLEWDAHVTLRSAERRAEGSNAGTGMIGTANPIPANMEIHVDTRLGASGVTDPITGTTATGSATNWFMAAAANRASTIEVAYLRGSNRRPRVRGYALDQGQYGVGWDINLDVGAKALDFRGLYQGNT